MALSTEWMKNLRDPSEKEGFELILRNSRTVLGRLQDIVLSWEAELAASELKMSDYDSPSWALKQADRIGDKRRIQKLKDLLSFLNGE